MIGGRGTHSQSLTVTYGALRKSSYTSSHCRSGRHRQTGPSLETQILAVWTMRRSTNDVNHPNRDSAGVSSRTKSKARDRRDWLPPFGISNVSTVARCSF